TNVNYCIVFLVEARMENLRGLQTEALLLLKREQASYAKPVSSEYIGKILNITPSYVRSQLAQMVRESVLGVRRGNGGGYYLIREEI
ncbi:MAG: Rrf2 family transcriptional regulator, partial [Bacillota bacterium]